MPIEDAQIYTAIMKGVSPAKRPQPEQTIMNTMRCPGCFSSFESTEAIGNSLLKRIFEDSNCNSTFEDFDEEMYNIGEFTKIDGRMAKITDPFNNYDDGVIHWQIEHEDGSKVTYGVEFDSLEKAEKFGQQFRKAAERGKAEAFLRRKADYIS